jgi:NADPH2:quinone reductase
VTINYTEEDFEEKVLELTEGKGVELVLECVGGPVLEKSVRCVASYGRLISYGNASGTPANIPSGDFTSANRTIIGFSMGRSPVGSLDHKAAMAEIFPMISAGQAKLVVDRVLPMSEAGQAHQHLSDRGSRGKVILVP